MLLCQWAGMVETSKDPNIPFMAKQAIAAQIVAVGDAVRALKAAKASKDEIMAKV